MSLQMTFEAQKFYRGVEPGAMEIVRDAGSKMSENEMEVAKRKARPRPIPEMMHSSVDLGVGEDFRGLVVVGMEIETERGGNRSLDSGRVRSRPYAGTGSRGSHRS